MTEQGHSGTSPRYEEASAMLLVQLARAGDIINVLPLAFCLSRKIGRVDWLVGHEYASILEGASYVRPVIWNGGQDTLHQALRRYRGASPLCLQAWLNPDPHQLTDSFAKEQWRYAGLLSERNAWPLIFDQRDKTREAALIERHIPLDRTRPLVLCATTSISTPFRHANKLIASIRGLDVDVIDMDDVRAERVYDILALLDCADLLVTVDSMMFHLSRAAHCPVIALLNNGWRGSVPHEQTVASFRYRDFDEDSVRQTVESML